MNKHEITEASAKEPATINKNVETILEMERQAVLSRSTAEHLADKVTTFGKYTVYHCSRILVHRMDFTKWKYLSRF